MAVKKRVLYEVLGVSQDIEVQEIARAYRRLALQYHPDRNPASGSDEMFKKISEAYSVLSDPAKRRMYDATGQLPLDVDPSTAVSEAQRSAEIEKQLADFFQVYRESAEEEEDFLKQYRKTKGNFKKMIVEYLIMDNGVDGEVDRLFALGQSLIEAGKLTATPDWTSSTTPKERSKIHRKLCRERKEAEEALQTMKEAHGASGDSSLGQLQAMMQARQQQDWSAMLNNLDKKYVKKSRDDRDGSSTKKKKSHKRSREETHEANQASKKK